MKENWHNNDLGNGLGDYNSPMDINKSWEALEEKRHPKKKRRPILFWLLGSLGLTLMIGFILWTNESKISKHTTHENINNVVNNPIDNSNNESYSDPIKPDTNTLSTDLESLVDPSIASSQSSSTGINNSYSSINNQSATTPTQLSRLEIERKKSDLVKSSTLFENKFTKTEDFQFQGIQKPTLIISKERNSKEEKKTKKKETNESGSNNLNISYNRIASIDIPSLTFNRNLPSLAINIPSKENSCLRNKSLRLGLSTGYALVSSGIVDMQETPLDAFSTFLSIEKPISSKFYFKTGFSYQQFNTYINNNLTSISYQLEEDVLVANNSFQNGTTEEVFEDVLVEYQETYNHKIYNRYRTYNIPILLGLQFDNGCSSWKLETGISANIFSNSTGNVIKNNELISFADLSSFNKHGLAALQFKSAGFYEHNFGSKYALSIGAEYNHELNKGPFIEGSDRNSFSSLGLVIGSSIKL